jgi:hypothetical protein
VECNDTSELDVTTGELEFTNISVVVVLKVFVVISLFDLSDDEAKEKYSVEVEKVFDNGSEDAKLVVKKVCLYSVVFSVGVVENVNGPVELTTGSVLVD